MPTSTILTGLPETPAGLADKEYSLLLPLYRAISNLAQQVSALSGTSQYSSEEVLGMGPFVQFGAQRMYRVKPVADVALPYGALVSLVNSAGTLKAVLADRTIASRPAHAIVDAPDGVASGAIAGCIMLQGLCAGVAGTVVGTQYWLGTAGTMQNTKPTVTGQIAQRVAIGMGNLGAVLCISGNGDIV